ncbi:hypothetical protein TrVE_jg7431 [Triparma verrucosa]|uniref:Uncharacterized protein n=2 Tax=Triparma TaxID=722752 RepID=A0A9W7ATA7_9STRA|nr:hypothetical protein TrST_g4005 [Triparma strigata]GMI13989.1 hypothetical protein TrVE_jg7431 [Triparma verrucosa]
MSSTPPSLPPHISFLTASLGGIGGWCVVHPFNSIAVRSSLASTSGTPFNLSSVIKSEGLGTLYKGLDAGCYRQLVYAGARFGLYEDFRDRLHVIRGKTDFGSRLITGGAAGGCAAYLSCPMEVCVVRMSNDASLPLNERRNYKGVFDAFKRVTKEEGVTTFWRGSTPFVQRAVMVGCFQVATYDELKNTYARLLGQVKNSLPNVFVSAMTSGLIYSAVTMPLEATKNRMAGQKPGKDGKLPYTGTMQTIAKVTKTEGFGGLYKGYGAYYLRCGGHTVCMFVLVSLLREQYAKMA